MHPAPHDHLPAGLASARTPVVVFTGSAGGHVTMLMCRHGGRPAGVPARLLP